jgi:GNAT superfamily N-acetyltransferase
MEIRQATDEDWPRIYPFWSTIVEAGETYAYPEGLDSEQARSLWMEPPPSHVVVAVDDDSADTDSGSGVVVGSAKMGPNRPGRGSHVATASFMVDPSRGSRGVGRALGEYVVAWAREQGYSAIQFNAVVETNERAVRLWRSLGFEVIGTVPEAFQHRLFGRVGLNIMYRKV